MSQSSDSDPSGARAGAGHAPLQFRSLEELSGNPQFEEALHREFPVEASEWTDDFSRRNFLKLMGASVALAGVAGCVKMPEERIVPYVHPPAEVTPGIPLYFATAHELRGFGRGVLVQQREGRPIKVEGNPQHPSSLGGTDVFMQASLLGLYDPDRSQTVIRRGEVSLYSAFTENFKSVAEMNGGAKARIALLTETITSPTIYDQIKRLQKRYPGMSWHQYSPVNRDGAREGGRRAFGRMVGVQYDYAPAQRILSLDSNFLSDDPGSLRYARQFTRNRRVDFQKGDIDKIDAWAMRLPQTSEATVPTRDGMSRLYVIESTATITGVCADHRLPVGASRIEAIAVAVAQATGLTVDGPGVAEARSAHGAFIDAVSKDLLAHPGRSLVVVGDEQPAAVHALAHLLNQHLGNIGKTVFITEPVEPEPVVEVESLADLVKRMNGGQVDMLIVMGANPVLTAPADFEFDKALEQVGWRAHLGTHADETAWLCHWHIPQSHYLESWSDIRGHDGTVSIIQPLIAPLYATVSTVQFLGGLLGESEPSDHDTVQKYWADQWKERAGADVDRLWTRALSDGVVAGTRRAVIQVKASDGWTPSSAATGTVGATDAGGARLGGGALEINFRADPTLFDGRYANNGWLQELPKPLSKLTWDNAALISPQLAVSLKLSRADSPHEANGKLVDVQVRGRTLRLPLYVLAGQPVEAITIYLGHGRKRAGRMALDHGFNAYPIRSSDRFWFDAGTLTDVGQSFALATTQNHFMLEGREMARTVPLEGALALIDAPPEPIDPDSYMKVDGKTVRLSLFPEWHYPGYKWGMSIDLSSCIGCNACVVACVAENNTPVVGKDQVLAGREMHWLRIDTYFAAGPDSLAALSNPRTVFQPMMCQHCENAPCELVCPVAATTHSQEGLNEMTYNRCVGTRYCSNNCPYKVRRFNFLQYSDQTTESLKLGRNPEVTVRSRGVMEKCTYCVQRIDHARIDAKIAWVKAREAGQDPPSRNIPPIPEERRNATIEALPPINVVPACAQACPTHAITFGDMNDADTLVHRMKETRPYQNLTYGVLTELNTRPRTTYLRRLKNPNAALSAEVGNDHAAG